MTTTVDHPTLPDFWRHNPPKLGACWVCGDQTPWVYLDIAYQHIDCDMYPTENGDVTIIKGVRQ